MYFYEDAGTDLPCAPTDRYDVDDLNGFRVSASPQTSNGNTIVSLTDIISPTGRKVEIRAEDWDDDDDEDLSGPA